MSSQRAVAQNIFFGLFISSRKVYPLQASGCAAVRASGGTVDPKTHRKWVWALIDAIAKLVDEVMSNHSVRTVQNVVFFIMTSCDEKDPMLASIRKCIIFADQKITFFSHPSSHPHRLCHQHGRLILKIKK